MLVHIDGTVMNGMQKLFIGLVFQLTFVEFKTKFISSNK